MSIYLDYAAATPIDSRVKRELFAALSYYGNPHSVHASGRAAAELLNQSKKRIGAMLNCRESELVMTGSGTEANNLAIAGVFPHDGHIISTTIEHHSVLRPLQQRGNVTFIPVRSNGIVDVQDIVKAIRPDTILVSVIYANNEIGTVQPIRAIKKSIGKILLHTDACQASGFLDINVQNIAVDLMTINAAKIYGPKGVGALFIRRGTKIEPQILGGDQERGLRAGTPNVALVAAFAKALEIAESMKEKESLRLTALRDWAIAEILNRIPNAHLNGDSLKRVPNNINISFDGIDGEMLMLRMDLRGVEISTGAACTVTSNEPSHVLQAIGAKDGDNVRMTLGRATTKKDLVKAIKILEEEIAALRKL